MKTLLLLLSYISCTTILAQETATKKITKEQTVTVKAKKSFIEQHIDKLVINTSADQSMATSTTLEALQKAPGITISAQDNISIAGKAGVAVWINGKPSQLAGKELANYLRGLPANAVDKIEIITNPNATFEAQGNAGIINIILKKIKTKGTNGAVSMQYTQSIHYRTNVNANINHRTGKVNVYLFANADNNLQHTNGTINRKVSVNNMPIQFNNATTDIDYFKNMHIRTGIDFYSTAKSTFSMQYNNALTNSPFSTIGKTAISNNNSIDSSLSTFNDNNYKYNRHNISSTYNFQDTVGNTIVVDADYTYFNNTNKNNINTSSYDKLLANTNNLINNLQTKTIINILQLKADYTKEYKANNAKLSTGVKYTNAITNNDLAAQHNISGVLKSDTGRTNTFNYTEKVAAAYINYYKRAKQWEIQLGTRVEFANIQGTSIDLKQMALQQPDTNYVNLFPSAFVSYAINNNNKITFSYSKRINRPSYQTLNPFEMVNDIYTYEKGNPYLRPQYTQNFELKHTYKYALQIGLGYNYTKDYSQTITQQKEQITSSTTINIGSLHNGYLYLSTPLPITKWWQGYATATLFYNNYNCMANGNAIQQKAWGLSYYIQHSFTLGKQWSTQLSSWYSAPTREAIFQTKSLGSVDIAVKKSFLKKKAAINVSITDIFNTQRWHQTVQFANMDFTYYRKWESRGVRIQFSYSFGSNKYSAKERNSDNEGGRIKTKG